MPKKLLTESQAWRVIAEAFAGPKPKKGDYDSISHSGLCNAFDRLCDDERITYSVQQDMKYRIGSAMEDQGMEPFFTFLFQRKSLQGDWMVNDERQAARNARSMIALWFALEAKAGE